MDFHIPIEEQPFKREDDNNKYAFDALIKAIKDRSVFAFIGSGCSKRVGYQEWEELLNILEERVKTINPSVRLDDYKVFMDKDNRDNLWYAEILKSSLPPAEFYNMIHNTYKNREIKDWSFHQSLVSINFRHYLTTNYDSLLESARLVSTKPLDYFLWNSKEKLKTFFEGINSVNEENRCVFHIHGRFDSEGSIILTEKDYLSMYYQEELAVKVLWSIIGSYKMCFIGFGMRDLDVLTVFRKVWWDFGRGVSRHFAFIKQNDKNKRIIHRQYMRDKYGINPIFFSTVDRVGDEYAELKQKIDDLAANRFSQTETESDLAKIEEITGMNMGA